MRQLISSFTLLLVLLSPAALAQPFSFGEPLPLPHTRYGAFSGEPRLVSSSHAAFLAWVEEGTLRMTLLNGERRVGRPILDVDQGWFDVVWTGQHFLAVAYRRTNGRDQLFGRIVDFNGEPVGAELLIGDAIGEPRLAYDGTFVLLQFRAGNFVGTVALTTEGRPLEPIPNSWVLPPVIVDVALAEHAPGFVTATAYPDVVAFAQTDSAGHTVASVPLAVARYDTRQIAIATNPARDILSVWTNPNAAMEAVIIRNDGTLLERLTIADSAGARDVAVTWDGSRWTLAYVAQGRMFVRRIDRVSPEERLAASDVDPDSTVTLTAVNGQTFAAFRGANTGEQLVVRNLTTGASDLAAFAAAQQTLYDVAPANGRALAVWSELRDGVRTLYAGTRSESGEWRERPIGTSESAAYAASDGTGFAVVRASGSTWTATLLDSQTRIVGTSSIVTGFTPTDVEWTGSAYAVIGLNGSGNLVGTLLMPSGSLTATRVLMVKRAGRSIENPRLASRTGELLAVWQDTQIIPCMPVCDPYDSLIHGARFTSTLDAADAGPFSIAPDEGRHPDAVWNGIHYVIVWDNDGALSYRTLRSNGAISGITQLPGGSSEGRVPRVSLIPGGVGIAFETGNIVALYEGSVAVFPALGRAGARDAIVTIGNDVAYLQTMPRDEMPYHGATRLQARIGSLVPHPARPSAPRIVRAELPPGGNSMIVEWSAPPEPVNGYRVEYRVDDGVWNELDEWYDANDDGFTIRPWRTTPTRYQFRVRAWSDAGLGAYSEPVTVRMVTLRQRSTRR